jgi:hypothetical protein
MSLIRASLRAAALAGATAATGYALMSLLVFGSSTFQPLFDSITLYIYMAFVVFLAALILGGWAHGVLYLLHRRSMGAYTFAGSLLGGGAAAAVFHLPETLEFNIGVIAAYTAAGWIAAATFWRTYIQPSQDPVQPDA